MPALVPRPRLQLADAAHAAKTASKEGVIADLGDGGAGMNDPREDAVDAYLALRDPPANDNEPHIGINGKPCHCTPERRAHYTRGCPDSCPCRDRLVGGREPAAVAEARLRPSVPSGRCGAVPARDDGHDPGLSPSRPQNWMRAPAWMNQMSLRPPGIWLAGPPLMVASAWYWR